MTNGQHTRQVVAYLSQDDYNLLHFLINATGIKQSPWIAGRYLVLGLQAELAKYGESLPNSRGERIRFSDLPPEIQERLNLELIAFRHRQQEQLQRTLNYLGTQTLDEKTLDRVLAIADELNLDVDEAARHAESPFVSAIAFANTSTVKGRCIHWLSDLFSEQHEIPIQVVLAESAKAGFSETITKRAKRAIGLGHRKREGDGVWCWHSPALEISSVPSSSSITLDGEHMT